MAERVYLATYDDGDLEITQVCSSVEAAKHWLAFHALPAEEWEGFAEALPAKEKDALGVTADRSNMTPDQVLGAWATPSESDPLTWGAGGWLEITIREQELFETTDDTAHHCPRCGRFTTGCATTTEGGIETWAWNCSCGARGTEGSALCAIEGQVWAWLNRHDAPWSPSDEKVADLVSAITGALGFTDTRTEVDG